MDYSRIARALRRWWIVVAGTVVLGLAAGLIYLAVAPQKFTARADVVVTVSGGNAVYLDSGARFAETQARNLSVLAPRQEVLAGVVRRLALPVTATKLAEDVSATVPTDSSIVTVQVVYPSATQATLIVNAVADSLSQAGTGLWPSASTGSTVSIRPIYLRTPPTKPSSPSLPAAIGVGVIGGLAVGVGVVLLLELARPTPYYVLQEEVDAVVY